MELKDAYKQGLMEEIKPLVDAGKITLLGTLEDVVEDLADALFRGLNKGAQLSGTPIDDAIVPPAVSMLEKYLDPQIDKIDGQEG